MYRRFITVLVLLFGLGVLMIGVKPAHAQEEATIQKLQVCYQTFQESPKGADDFDTAKTCVSDAATGDSAVANLSPETQAKVIKCFTDIPAGTTNIQSVLGCVNIAFPGFIFVPRPVGALESLPTILSAGIRLILIVAGLIAFVILLLGGIKWITSGGDKGQVEAARGQILQALIGLIVVLATWGLIVIVQAATNICLGFGCDLVLPTLY